MVEFRWRVSVGRKGLRTAALLREWRITPGYPLAAQRGSQARLPTDERDAGPVRRGVSGQRRQCLSNAATTRGRGHGGGGDAERAACLSVDRRGAEGVAARSRRGAADLGEGRTVRGLGAVH